MNDITAILNVRRNSSRCPDKLLRSFSGTTLFDIALSKLLELNIPIDNKWVCAYDYAFLSPVESKYIPVFRRSKESVSVDGPLTVVFEAVKHVTTKYFMFINPCVANISVKTLQSAIDLFQNSDFSSMTSVVRKKDWIYDSNGKVIIDGTVAGGDTKKTQEIYVVAHAFHIINVDFFLKNDKYWTNGVNDPYLFEINKLEALDVDDENDFIISESVYSRLKK